jgi:Cu/Ag efflux protein CusF
MPHRFLSILLLAFGLCACTHNPSPKAPIERYTLDGTILQLDAQAHIAKIDGQEIKGWMEAMTMEYQVKDQNEFSALHVGDQITATVFVQGLNYWIGEIHQVR